MEFKNITYRNDDGNIVSKEDFEKEYSQFEQAVDNFYNLKVNSIISRINAIASTDLEKLWMLYDYLTSEDMVYNLQGVTQDGRRALDLGYSFSDYKTWKISQNTKYPALINNSGVCITYALAFEDLANKLRIPCRVVNGFTGMEHAWNIVLINNDIKYVDIAYAIMNKNTRNKKDFFLKDIKDIGNRTINSDVRNLELEMKQQYINQNSQIKINSRSDISPKPEITVISRRDMPSKQKITITNRTDTDSNGKLKR